jgi:putative hydrolase of the HAD superfamily
VLGIRAVVFDFGMVLTGTPDKAAHDGMVRITGLTESKFEPLYWADRHAYDEGKLTGPMFWEKFARESGLALTPEQLAELNRQDAKMWTTYDPGMVDWQRRLKERGLKTAILSNMGDSVLENIAREFAWIHDFDVLVWSFQERMAKPEPEIYRRTLERLGTAGEETLFIDDKRVNVEGARALGIRAIEFSSRERLREQIVAEGLDGEIPLPV